MLKDQCYVEEDEGLEEYFVAVMGRGSVQAELLDENISSSSFKERAVNTDLFQDDVRILINHLPSSITFEKGIQVQLDEDNTMWNLKQKVYVEHHHIVRQIKGPEEEEERLKENKQMILHHRQSRKNSLTLLELQSLQAIKSPAERKYQKGKHKLSNFGKRHRLKKLS